MTVTQTVEKTLKENLNARSSDKTLFILLMQEYGIYLTQEQKELFGDMPSLESIRRTRQKLQELGKYPASDRVKSERSHKSMVMQQTMPKAKPEQVNKTLNYRVLPWGKG